MFTLKNHKFLFLGTSILLCFTSLSYAKDFDYLPTEVNHCQFVHHVNYNLCYDEKSEQAEWVSYELTREEVYGRHRRTDDFKSDPVIKTGSADLSDYKGSGYDRGHLAPAGDMKFTNTAIHESFYFSNMSPQVPAFNRGIWNHLEQQVRVWARIYGKLYIETGGILQGNKRIGHDGVLVPPSYYKIVYAPAKHQMIGFLLPNKGSKKSLQSYIVPVDFIEEKTGINFFSQMKETEQAKLESKKSSVKLWIWGRYRIYHNSYSHSHYHYYKNK